MEFKNDSTNYGIIEKLLHWSIAVLVLTMLSVSFFFDDIADKTLKHEITNLHKITGLVILCLMVLRLIWRLMNVQPKLPFTVPAWQHILSHTVHYLLYLFVITMPLAGWIMTSASGKPPHIGACNIALPGIPASKALADICWTIHETIAWVLIVLITLHILAALKHALIDHDGVLKRMWF